MFATCCFVIFLSQEIYDPDKSYVKCSFATNTTCLHPGTGFDVGRMMRPVRFFVASLSLLATVCVLVRLARQRFRNQFNHQLITTFLFFDFCSAFENLLGNLPIGFIKTQGLACAVVTCNGLSGLEFHAHVEPHFDGQVVLQPL
jgi:hypothetical protein